MLVAERHLVAPQPLDDHLIATLVVAIDFVALSLALQGVVEVAELAPDAAAACLLTRTLLARPAEAALVEERADGGEIAVLQTRQEGLQLLLGEVRVL